VRDRKSGSRDLKSVTPPTPDFPKDLPLERPITNESVDCAAAHPTVQSTPLCSAHPKTGLFLAIFASTVVAGTLLNS